jgi:hypothetical protein
MVNHLTLALALTVFSLAFGTLGYHFLARAAWIDALLNASMLLGGMGPVGDIPTAAGKLFASFYALYAGLVFIAISGIVLSPLLHRVLHRFHVPDEE